MYIIYSQSEIIVFQDEIFSDNVRGRMEGNVFSYRSMCYSVHRVGVHGLGKGSDQWGLGGPSS